MKLFREGSQFIINTLQGRCMVYNGFANVSADLKCA